MTDEPRNVFDQTKDEANVEAERRREYDRRVEAAKQKADTQKASEEADAKKGDEAARSAKPLVETSPLVGGKPDVNPAMVNPMDGPVVHGEAAQRYVNKTSAHSERTVNGGVVTPVVRKERYEHPERK
jgi:hypothetical protein